MIQVAFGGNTCYLIANHQHKLFHVVTWKIENIPHEIVYLAQIFRQNAESVRVHLDICNKISQERDELKKEFFILPQNLKGSRGSSFSPTDSRR